MPDSSPISLPRSINTFTMKDFNEMMDKKDIILVFAKNVNCRACEEDRWWTAKVPYNFLLTPNVLPPIPLHCLVLCP